ncbi:response regulator [soil metagenome]
MKRESKAIEAKVGTGDQNGAVVFLAEDDDEMRALVSGALRDAGYRVVEATDGGEMLQLVRDAVFDEVEKPDLVVMDVRMPMRTGLWLLRVIRRAEWDVPVILMTAFGDRGVRDEAAELESVFLDKPFDVEELRATVRNIQLERARSRSDGVSPPPDA